MRGNGFLGLALVALGAAACGSTVEGASSDGEGGSGNGSNTGNSGNQTTVIETDCGEVDVACPAMRPFAGSPCEGDLQCTYVEDNGFTTWTSTCLSGAWTSSASCGEEPIGGTCGGTPPTAEACSNPFGGTLEASVEIGPASEEIFRPFFDGEEVSIEWGGQGSPMVFYRLKLGGPELPTCVGLTVSVESPLFFEPFPYTDSVVLRCGQSLSMYTIVPYGECTTTEGTFDATVRVTVAGVGEVVRVLRVPMEALCGGQFG